jgi:hypothetical protein
MSRAVQQIELVRPVAFRSTPGPIDGAPRPSDLNGCTVHLIQGLPHGSGMEELLAAVAAELHEHFPNAKVIEVVRRDRYMSDDPAQRAAIVASDRPCVIYFGSPTGALNQVAARYCVELERAHVPCLLVVPAIFAAAVWHIRDLLQCPLSVVTTTSRDATPDVVSAVRNGLNVPARLPRLGESFAEEVSVAVDAAEDFVRSEGWDDGLPFQLPTREAVERMLTGTAQDGSRIVSTTLGPDLLSASVRLVAANAVLAGAQPRHLPLLLATTEALGRSEAVRPMLGSVNGFCFPLVVNGPVREAAGLERGMTSIHAKAHRAIERAVGLILQNLAGVRPGESAFAVQGHPAAPFFLIVENEEASPWESFAQQRGCAPHESRLTLFGGGWSHAGTYFYPEDGLDLLAGAIARFEMPHSALILMSPDRAHLLARAGHDKASVAAEIRDKASIDLRTFRRSGYFNGRIRDRIRHEQTWPSKYLEAPDDELVPAYPADRIQIVITGSEGAPIMSAWKFEEVASASPDIWR